MSTRLSVNSELTRMIISYVSEMLYIHSKLMIVDDQKVIVCVLLRYLLSLF